MPEQENEKLIIARYFQTLPTWIQESIRQSGMHWNTQDEMRQFVEHLNKQ